jgi:hypothetical protein
VPDAKFAFFTVNCARRVADRRSCKNSDAVFEDWRREFAMESKVIAGPADVRAKKLPKMALQNFRDIQNFRVDVSLLSTDYFVSVVQFRAELPPTPWELGADACYSIPALTS